MKTFFLARAYSPYISGLFTGLLFVISVVTVDGYFGSSSTFARIASYFMEVFGWRLDQIPFFVDGKYTYHNLFNFQTFLLIGLFVGALLSVLLSRTFCISLIPPLFNKRFGNKVWLRMLLAFIGGMIMIIGARIADGCASWWGISSASKLDLAAFANLIMFFIGGVIVNYLIYRRK